ncbi:MAG: diguanylate cyclase [Candidatus Limiplasma sp.]|nr:diguanylate cyclase [Candidatus Limiplasma sp.]
MDSAIKLLRDYLKDALGHLEPAVLDMDALPQGFQALGQELSSLSRSIQEACDLAKALSKGDLHVKLPPVENEIAAPLKALHAALKHLTWQTQQIAKGDYQQRVDFMGDFSDAFNSMTEQLERQRKMLLKELEDGRQKAKALEQSKSMFEAITSNISQWIIVMDGSTYEWLFSNHSAADVLRDMGREPELWLWLNRQAAAFCRHHPRCSMDLELTGESGTQYFAVEGHRISWYQHDAIAFVLTDVSVEKEHLNDLQDAAYTDKLTQLYSRHYGMKTLTEWLAGQQDFILCFVDIDNLKYVNDRFGHIEGDRYIITVADMLRGFSSEAILCRLGGDEFMLLAQGWSSHQAIERMEELRARLISQRGTKSALYEESISYGVIEIGTNNTLSVNDLLGIVDEKMYEYKRAYKLKQRKAE